MLGSQQNSFDGTGGGSFFVLKAQIRTQIRDQRNSLSQKYIAQASQKVLLSLIAFEKIENWLIFASIENEISTKPLFDWLSSKQKKIYLPAVTNDRLQFRKIQDWTELTQGKFCPEPPESNPAITIQDLLTSVTIVPGVAFLKNGHRLGYGKGHFDKFFSENPSNIRVGIGFDFQLLFSDWPTEKHDQTMHFIATPGGLWSSLKVGA